MPEQDSLSIHPPGPVRVYAGLLPRLVKNIRRTMDLIYGNGKKKSHPFVVLSEEKNMIV